MVSLGYFIERSVGVTLTCSFIIISIYQLLLCFFRDYPKLKWRIHVVSLLLTVQLFFLFLDPGNVYGLVPRIFSLLIVAISGAFAQLAWTFIIFGHFQAHFLVLNQEIPTFLKSLYALIIVYLIIAVPGQILMYCLNKRGYGAFLYGGLFCDMIAVLSVDVYGYIVLRNLISDALRRRTDLLSISQAPTMDSPKSDSQPIFSPLSHGPLPRLDLVTNEGPQSPNEQEATTLTTVAGTTNLEGAHDFQARGINRLEKDQIFLLSPQTLDQNQTPVTPSSHRAMEIEKKETPLPSKTASVDYAGILRKLAQFHSLLIGQVSGVIIYALIYMLLNLIEASSAPSYRDPYNYTPDIYNIAGLNAYFMMVYWAWVPFFKGGDDVEDSGPSQRKPSSRTVSSPRPIAATKSALASLELAPLKTETLTSSNSGYQEPIMETPEKIDPKAEEDVYVQ